MSDSEYEDPTDELLDSLPLHLRNKVLKQAYGDPEVQGTEQQPPQERLARQMSGPETALWWLLLPFACALSLALVGLAVLAAAMLLLPVAAVLGALAALPVGLMALWRLQ